MEATLMKNVMPPMCRLTLGDHWTFLQDHDPEQKSSKPSFWNSSWKVLESASLLAAAAQKRNLSELETAFNNLYFLSLVKLLLF